MSSPIPASGAAVSMTTSFSSSLRVQRSLRATARGTGTCGSMRQSASRSKNEKGASRTRLFLQHLLRQSVTGEAVFFDLGHFIFLVHKDDDGVEGGHLARLNEYLSQDDDEVARSEERRVGKECRS